MSFADPILGRRRPIWKARSLQRVGQGDLELLESRVLLAAFKPPITTSLGSATRPFYPSMTADLNGDGQQDVLFHSGGVFGAVLREPGGSRTIVPAAATGTPVALGRFVASPARLQLVSLSYDDFGGYATPVFRLYTLNATGTAFDLLGIRTGSLVRVSFETGQNSTFAGRFTGLEPLDAILFTSPRFTDLIRFDISGPGSVVSSPSARGLSWYDGAQPIEVDFDQNGISEIIYAADSGPAGLIQRYTAGGSSIPITLPGIVQASGLSRTLHRADIDGDGRSDLIAAFLPSETTSTWQLAWSKLSASGVQSGWQSLGSLDVSQGYGVLKFGDFNGDGKADAILEGGVVRAMIGDGSGFRTAETISDPGDYQFAELDDLPGLDLVTVGSIGSGNNYECFLTERLAIPVDLAKVSITTLSDQAIEPRGSLAATPAVLRVRRDTTAGSLTLPFTLSGDAAAAGGFTLQANGVTLGSNTLTFAPGQESIVLTVTPTADGVQEPTRTLTVTLQPPPRVGVEDGLGSASIRMIDGEYSTVSMSITDAIAAEVVGGRAPDTGEFEVRRTGRAGDLAVSVRVRGIPATRYQLSVGSTPVQNGIVVIPDGEQSVRVKLIALDDGILNTAERTARLSILAGSEYALDAPARRRGSIIIRDRQVIIDSVESDGESFGRLVLRGSFDPSLRTTVRFTKGSSTSVLAEVPIASPGADRIAVTLPPMFSRNGSRFISGSIGVQVIQSDGPTARASARLDPLPVAAPPTSNLAPGQLTLAFLETTRRRAQADLQRLTGLGEGQSPLAAALRNQVRTLATPIERFARLVASPANSTNGRIAAASDAVLLGALRSQVRAEGPGSAASAFLATIGASPTRGARIQTAAGVSKRVSAVDLNAALLSGLNRLFDPPSASASTGENLRWIGGVISTIVGVGAALGAAAGFVVGGSVVVTAALGVGLVFAGTALLVSTVTWGASKLDGVPQPDRELEAGAEVVQDAVKLATTVLDGLDKLPTGSGELLDFALEGDTVKNMVIASQRTGQRTVDKVNAELRGDRSPLPGTLVALLQEYSRVQNRISERSELWANKLNNRQPGTTGVITGWANVYGGIQYTDATRLARLNDAIVVRPDAAGTVASLTRQSTEGMLGQIERRRVQNVQRQFGSSGLASFEIQLSDLLRELDGDPNSTFLQTQVRNLTAEGPERRSVASAIDAINDRWSRIRWR